MPRPVRPSRDWNGPHLGNRPASTKVVHKPVDPEAHARFAKALKDIPPERR